MYIHILDFYLRVYEKMLMVCIYPCKLFLEHLMLYICIFVVECYVDVCFQVAVVKYKCSRRLGLHEIAVIQTEVISQKDA